MCIEAHAHLKNKRDSRSMRRSIRFLFKNTHYTCKHIVDISDNTQRNKCQLKVHICVPIEVQVNRSHKHKCTDAGHAHTCICTWIHIHAFTYMYTAEDFMRMLNQFIFSIFKFSRKWRCTVIPKRWNSIERKKIQRSFFILYKFFKMWKNNLFLVFKLR